MKKILTASLLTTVILLGTVFAAATPRSDSVPVQSEPVRKEAVPLRSDSKRTVSVLCGDEVKEFSVYDYLVGVLAAEMPVSFEPEALKAQAVAARSYLECGIAAHKHSDADICSDPACCQAFILPDELKDIWSESYELYAEKLRAAVSATDGEYLSYDGEAALCAFHSSSAGMTEDSGAVWGEVPYLVSVDSPETKDNVPNYITKVTLSDIDFRDTVLYLKPDADLTGEPGAWVKKITRDESGRVESVSIGGETLTGSEMRSLFSLRSTAFKLRHGDNGFTFTVTGSGHGIGMSQYGANAMASDGRLYDEILSHYYPGTELIRK